MTTKAGRTASIVIGGELTTKDAKDAKGRRRERYEAVI
jgi:hypothetical protein